MTLLYISLYNRVKAQYGEATMVRVPSTRELTFRHCQEYETDTWQYVTSLDHFCGTIGDGLSHSDQRKTSFGKLSNSGLSLTLNSAN